MKKTTRNWLIIGAVGAGAIVIWYVMRSRSAAASTDPSIDPATGQPYSAENYAGGVGTTPSLYGYTDPSTGAFISGVGSGSGGFVSAPSTNASWAQQVEAYLQNLGYNPTAVAAAIGKYLTGQTLTNSQAGIVSAAQGFFGNPPQGAPPISHTNPGGNTNGSRFINVAGRNDWYSVMRDTLGKVKLNNSGWYRIHGQRVYYSKAHGTIGFEDPTKNKWIKRTL